MSAQMRAGRHTCNVVAPRNDAEFTQNQHQSSKPFDARSKALPACRCGRDDDDCEREPDGWCFDQAFEEWVEYQEAVAADCARRRRLRACRSSAVLGRVLQ